MPPSVLIENKEWENAIGADIVPLVEKTCGLTLQHAPVLDTLLPGERAQLTQSIVLADDAAVQELNRDFRAKDAPTNVLSFPAYDSVQELRAALAAPVDNPMMEDAGYLGDMILALETLQREAQEQQKTLRDHFCHLLVHGTLHLLGYDHLNDAEAETMEALEIHILKELSIANPYE